jgi:Protein of unknown function (DUF3237)
MESLTRRRFAKLSAAAAAIGVGPFVVGSRLASTVMRFRNDETPLGEGPRGQPAQADTLQSTFLMDLTLETGRPHTVGGVGAGRLVVPVSGGSFDGPRIKGSVVAPGGDWIVERSDRSRILDVRILLETDDAQTIYVSWRGIAYTTPGGGLFARILPVFETGAPNYTWLNNVVSVGVYRGLQGKIAYRIFEIL